MGVTRRTAIGALGSLLPTAMAQTASLPPGQTHPVSLTWLGDDTPGLDMGVSWGVPFPRGSVTRNQSFHLIAGNGSRLPLQHWPLAWWPDGSVKWSGFATVAPAGLAGPFQLALGSAEAATTPTIRVTQVNGGYRIDTGVLQCRLAGQGANLIESMTVEGRDVAQNGRLVAIREDRSRLETEGSLRLETFESVIRKVTVEHQGPVRAAVKIEGRHHSKAANREWLPFIVRLYFYAGHTAVRMVHTFVFDGDEQKDFIRGIGVRFSVPFREQIHNRHVRFSGEEQGLWSEPIQPLTGRRPLTLPGGGSAYTQQLAGKRVPDREAFDARGQKLLKDWASWSAFKLVQTGPDGFQIFKQTNPESCWLEAGGGRRASGLLFAGDVSGGLAIAVKNFWQSHPASLEIRNARNERAEVTAWLWSPDAPAMDLRHYDTVAHDLDSSYEDVQPGFSTPHGIARTSELMLYPSAVVPEKKTTVEFARLSSRPPLLVCSPQYLNSARVFGIWSLPDRSTAFKKSVEDQLDAVLALYEKEIEQRRWYGFWNYGDVMHAYDSARHVWRYDIGGYAWDNTELGTDLWLWYSFLRTGSSSIFRMAEAMTRHTSEVDCYHLGRFAMLGSRHNVRHWGCGAKELRISQAAYRRFFYYLTTDERTGDLMHEVADADSTLLQLDPMRLARPLSQMPSRYPARIRGGPDWLAVVGNWMTEWERTGDTRYRDKIIAGMDSISGFPYRFLSGPENLYGYDPATGKLYTLVDDPFGTYNLTTNMGGAEVVFELNELIDHPGWRRTWLQYCRLFRASKEVIQRDMSTGDEGSDASLAGEGRLAAYVYHRLGQGAFARRAIAQLTRGGPRARRYETRRIEAPEVLQPIDENPTISTNNAAQSSLEAIQILAMCADQLPENTA